MVAVRMVSQKFGVRVYKALVAMAAPACDRFENADAVACASEYVGDAACDERFAHAGFGAGYEHAFFLWHSDVH